MSVCGKQRLYLRQHGLDVEDAAQSIIVQILEHLDGFNPAKSQWQTYVTNVAKRRLRTLCRDASRLCRRLPPNRIAPEKEVEGAAEEADEEIELALLKIPLDQAARYLMLAGKKMARSPHDRSPYSPESRLIVAYLAGRQGMGYRAIRSQILDDPELMTALKWKKVPKPALFQRWLNLGSPQNVLAAVRGVTGGWKHPGGE